MGILDRFRKKEEKSREAGSRSAGKKVSKKEENVLDLVQETQEAPKTTESKSNTGLAHRVLKHHHLSEKTNIFSTTGRYVFKVATNANKIEVKKAIEKVYDVHVTKVNMVNVRGKKRRYGRTFGKTQDWKKAIVTLKTGERISGLSQGV
jgi:large subunit ribosomal protein L23